MQQTAVEFLLSHIWTTDWVNYTREEKMNVINQAKAMFEQQIIEAFDIGESNAIHRIVQERTDTIQYGGQYYNETFKSE